MGGDIVLTFSPFVFVIMSLYILFEFIRINKLFNMWEINSLMVVPVLLSISYLYIGLFSPSVEWSRIIVRAVMSVNLAIVSHVVYSCSRALRKGGLG